MFFELFCRYWNPHQVVELIVCCLQAHIPQTGWNQKVNDVDSKTTSPPTDQKNVQELATPCSLNTDSSWPFPGRDAELCGHWPAVAPFAWQSIKAILSPSSKALSLQFCVAPVYRGRVSETHTYPALGNFSSSTVWNSGSRHTVLHILNLLIACCSSK